MEMTLESCSGNICWIYKFLINPIDIHVGGEHSVIRIFYAAYNISSRRKKKYFKDMPKVRTSLKTDPYAYGRLAYRLHESSHVLLQTLFCCVSLQAISWPITQIFLYNMGYLSCDLQYRCFLCQNIFLLLLNAVHLLFFARLDVYLKTIFRLRTLKLYEN